MIPIMPKHKDSFLGKRDTSIPRPLGGIELPANGCYSPPLQDSAPQSPEELVYSLLAL